MNTSLNNPTKILLVDDILKVRLDENPSRCRELAEGYKIKTYDDLRNETGFFFKDSEKNKLIPISSLSELSRPRYLVESNVYENTYVDLRDYEQQYWKDLMDFFMAFCSKTGAKHYGCEHFVEKTEGYRWNSEESVNGDGRYGVVSGGVDYSGSDSMNRSYSYKGLLFRECHSKENALPKEKVKEWLCEKNVNWKELQDISNFIELFLENGKLASNLNITFEETTLLGEARESAGSINAALKVGLPLSAAFKSAVKSDEEIKASTVRKIRMFAEYI